MKSLIIGGAGFVGAYLSEELQKYGEVVLTKLLNETVDKNGAKVRNLDVGDQTAVIDILQEEKPDWICHLAAISSVAASWKKPDLTVDVNIKGAIHLLEAARALDYMPRILLIGSSEEYGRINSADCPVREELPVNPSNIYAATKACQNMLGKLYCKAYGLDVILVRAFNHIGPRQLPGFVVPDFCRQIASIEKGEQEPVIRVGNLAAKRDFTDVRDIVRAYRMLLENGRMGETYNVGSGQAVSIESLLQGLLAMASCPIQVETDSEKFRPVDVPLIEADTSKLFAVTGWKRQIELAQTLRETLNEWRSKEYC